MEYVALHNRIWFSEQLPKILNTFAQHGDPLDLEKLWGGKIVPLGEGRTYTILGAESMAKTQKTQESIERKPIYVEFPSTSDGKAPKDLPEASQKAIDQVVATLQEVSRQVIDGMEELSLEQRPAEIQLEFGIRFDDEHGAILSLDREQAAFSAKVVWYHKDKPVATLRSVAGLIPPVQDDD